MISPDNIPLNPLKNGQLWISHYPGKRGIENKAIQAEMDLLELKKRKIDIVASLLERKELAELQIANLFELIKKHNFSHYYFPIKDKSAPKNKVQLDSLTCSGKLCPVSDLLQYCTTNPPIINISNEKTRYGYPLTGKCLDNIKDKTDVFEAIWAVRKGNDIFVQLLIKVGSARLNILVPLIPK